MASTIDVIAAGSSDGRGLEKRSHDQIRQMVTALTRNCTEATASSVLIIV